VKTICVAYEGMEKFFPLNKVKLTGNPIRQDIITYKDNKAEALKAFSLKEGSTTLLVIGGSLGARTINHCIQAGLDKLAENTIQLIWQTGLAFASKAADAVQPFAERGIISTAFIGRMDLAYAAADIVISRSGAIAISELCMAGKPCILVPSPNVTDDHQTKNTLALTAKKAAIMVTDAEAHEKLIPAVLELAGNTVLQAELKTNIRRMAHPNAAESIADEAIKLIRTSI
jgi:UDP-N-acetylglucosamine--N-acetylmuramyl-(pentapeptide) pyrophosphoryl-undecaprenol N-acetylglucosamine transferase